MGGLVEYDLRPGGIYRAYPGEAMKRHGAELGFEVPEVAMDGEVIEADEPHRLVQTFRMLLGDEEVTKEGFTTLTWEIEERGPSLSRLTVVHDVQGAPRLAAMVNGDLENEGAGGGWPEVISALKSILETGEPLR
jgi:uncharacterized protein YndB with AHSA1/START domain